MTSGGIQMLRALLVVLLVAATPMFGGSVSSYLNKPDEWFRSGQAMEIATNVLSWQAPEGGWPKNVDTTVPFAGERSQSHSTFDNHATTDELRYLARMAASERSYIAPFLRGLDYILTAQYTNGGWPQFSPPPKDKYHRHITFNDGTMVRLLEFMREVRTDKRYSFAPDEMRQSCQRAFDRGIDCTLKCQIRVNGKLTVWCAQHDEIDFGPRPARAFELVSLSGSESVGIVRLLMSLEKPSPEVVRSIDAAVVWFESAKIPGIKVVELEAKDTPKGKDRTVVKDTNAKPMWARFYEIDTNRPFFCGRDGVRKYALADIEYERRNGYAWLGYWPEPLLTNDYPAWKARIGKP
jgi:PelA/Pel-15E family pectate lyase